MIQFVVLGLLCSAAVISGAPAGEGAHRTLPEPPNAAAEARRLVYDSDWASVGTLSTYKTNAGLPMVSVVSTADSKSVETSTGNIYFVLIDGDMPTIDIAANNKVTFMFTEAQGDECKRMNAEPMGHGCARAMITGEVVTVEPNTPEYASGLAAYADRHRFINRMPHGFKLCKLKISNILVFSGYAEPSSYREVKPEEYFAIGKKEKAAAQ